MATSRSTRSAPTCARVRAYAGLDPVAGPGVTISIDGPIDGPGVEELINELRNAGAEAIAVGPVRVVPGVVVTGAPGAAAVDGVPLEDGFEVAAIGAPDKLTGSLTRSGGVIAQLAATQPDVVVDGHAGRSPGARRRRPRTLVPRPWSSAPLIP